MAGAAVAAAAVLNWITPSHAGPIAAQKVDATYSAIDRSEPKRGAWLDRHAAFVATAKQGGIDLLFIGDSITAHWTTRAKALWDKEFGRWKPANFGLSGDLIQNVLYRIRNGELDNIAPKVIVVLVGSNNLAWNSAEQIAKGIWTVIEVCREKQPVAKVLLLGIFPRNEAAEDPIRRKIDATNQLISKYANGTDVRYLDINAKFLGPDGRLSRELLPGGVHLSVKGYRVWADAIRPQLTEWLGS